MKKQEALEVYKKGRPPKIETMAGVWKVKMWGWWRWMRLDKKVITYTPQGYSGHNTILGFTWGNFKVVQQKYRIQLKYDNGKIVDYLKLHPTRGDMMAGRFLKNGSYIAPFVLEKVGAAILPIHKEWFCDY